MNTYKNIAIVLIIGLGVATRVQAANGNFTQLDQAGINVIVELRKTYEGFIKATQQPYLHFDLAQWTFLLKTNVKKYVEDYSTIKGIPDKELMYNLNLLLQINETLIQRIEFVQGFQKPNIELNEADYSFLIQKLLNPFEQIEQNIKNIIVPELETQSYYLSADKKNKAQEMLLRVFNLERLMADAMINYTIRMIYMD